MLPNIGTIATLFVLFISFLISLLVTPMIIYFYQKEQELTNKGELIIFCVTTLSIMFIALLLLSHIVSVPIHKLFYGIF